MNCAHASKTICIRFNMKEKSFTYIQAYGKASAIILSFLTYASSQYKLLKLKFILNELK